MTFLERAISDGHASIAGDEKRRRITYRAVNHSERYDDAEEQVRAEYWAELVYRYGYEPARIGLEVIVPDRTPKDAADLVVFHDADRRRPYAVIECKADGVTDAEFNQAVEQACGNGTWAKLRADYVGVVAGQTRRFLDFSSRYGVLEREANIIADLPRQYGRPEEFRFRKGSADDIRPVSRESLIAAIRKCHQTLWGGGRLSPPAAFGELCKIIFVKISDENTPRRKGEPYQFQIKTHESSQKLADRIRALYNAQRDRDPEVFSEPINIDDAMLRTLVSHLEAINLSDTDLDTKGVAFEQFMDSFFKGGFGQYFTPREIIAFAIDVLDPQHDELILDPACGSGGFLLYALDHIRREASEYYQPDSKEHYRHWHDFAQRNLYGLEINNEIARVAKMNMIVHDDGHTNICGEDALERLARIRESTRNDAFREGRFDLVLTNPPFGAQVTVAEKHYLPEYVLGTTTGSRGNARPRRSQKTEVLFIERIWQFLKPGEGRAAVILPDGILANASLQYVRDFIVERFQVLAIVSLPATAFSHFGAGVNASVLFLRKRSAGEACSPDESIFMALPEQIGYDATGRKCRNDLPAVAQGYRGHVRGRPAAASPEEEPPGGLVEFFSVRLASCAGGRIDAYYHAPRFAKLTAALAGCPFKKVPLGVISPTIVGGATPTRGDESLYAQDGIKFLRIMNVTPSGIDVSDVKFIQGSVHEGELARSQLAAEDVLMTITGRVGTAAVVPESILPANINQHIVRLRVEHRECCLPEYLAAYLNSSLGNGLTNRLVTGGTRIALDYDAIRGIEVPLPPRPVQEQMVADLEGAREEAARLRALADATTEAARERFDQALAGEG